MFYLCDFFFNIYYLNCITLFVLYYSHVKNIFLWKKIVKNYFLYIFYYSFRNLINSLFYLLSVRDPSNFL